jgi:hypothetical protein
MILLVVGVGVVALGALVLLLFSDRPGGKIAWRGVEVSSIGAGLPLIVVGLAAIAIWSGGVIRGDGGDSGDQTIAALRCPDDLAKSVSAQRIATVESGVNAQIVAGPTVSKTEPFGLRLTDGGETVGAMTVRFSRRAGCSRSRASSMPIVKLGTFRASPSLVRVPSPKSPTGPMCGSFCWAARTGSTSAAATRSASTSARSFHRRRGSCCGARTTCSSSGATPTPSNSTYQPLPETRRTPSMPAAPSDSHRCRATPPSPVADRGVVLAAGREASTRVL